MSNEIIKKESEELAVQNSMPMGFEDEEADDIIIPRVKVIQALSPERKDKIADEGDIINSLTKERLNGKVFVPVFKFNNNVLWRDRNDGGGIICTARDGRLGVQSDGTTLMCANCRKCEFDNTKQGREAMPSCTKYINFFGFFAGERAPIILSFSKTCYNEGKKLYSLAKVTMQNMWHYGYTLNEKKMVKANNEWYVPVMTAAGATDEEDRAFGMALYKMYRNNMQNLEFDMDDAGSSSSDGVTAPVDTNTTEF